MMERGPLSPVHLPKKQEELKVSGCRGRRWGGCSSGARVQLLLWTGLNPCAWSLPTPQGEGRERAGEAGSRGRVWSGAGQPGLEQLRGKLSAAVGGETQTPGRWVLPWERTQPRRPFPGAAGARWRAGHGQQAAVFLLLTEMSHFLPKSQASIVGWSRSVQPVMRTSPLLNFPFSGKKFTFSGLFGAFFFSSSSSSSSSSSFFFLYSK